MPPGLRCPVRTVRVEISLALLAAHGEEDTLLLPRPLPLAGMADAEGNASSSLEAHSAAAIMALNGSGLLHIDEAELVELMHAGLLEHWPKLRALYRQKQDFSLAPRDGDAHLAGSRPAVVPRG